MACEIKVLGDRLVHLMHVHFFQFLWRQLLHARIETRKSDPELTLTAEFDLWKILVSQAKRFFGDSITPILAIIANKDTMKCDYL
jgi:hypothetical protein